MTTDQCPDEREGVDLTSEEALVAKLRERTISLRRAIVFAFVDLQIGPSLAVLAGYLILTGGGNNWCAIIVAGLLILSVTEVVRIFSSRYIVTGGLMTYLVKAGWRRAGLFVGSANLVGYLALAAAVSTGVTFFTQAAFSDLGWTALETRQGQAIAFVVIAALLTAVALRGLQIASRIAIVLGLACIPFVFWITIQAVVMSRGVDWGVLTPDLGNLAALVAPVTLVLSNYIGFDGWAFLATETDQPQRNVPRILHFVALVSLGLFLLVVVAQTPLLVGHEADIEAGTSPLSILAGIAGLQGLGTVLNIALALALFGAGITTLTYGGRLLAAGATVGLLPKAVAKVSRSSNSPFVAMLILGAAMAFLPLALSMSVEKTPIEAGIYFSEATAYLWSGPYVVAGVIGIVVVWRSTRRAWLSIAAASICVAGYASFLGYSLHNGWQDADSALPWICVAIVFVTFVSVFAIDRRHDGQLDVSALDDPA